MNVRALLLTHVVSNHELQNVLTDCDKQRSVRTFSNLEQPTNLCLTMSFASKPGTIRDY